MPMTARAPIQGAKATAAFGKSGMARRRKPYPPIFRRTPASSTEPAVGASTWASGSQVWKGNIGTFMAKARAKAAKSHIWRRGSTGSWASAAMSKLRAPAARYTTRKPTSIRTLPAMV